MVVVERSEKRGKYQGKRMHTAVGTDSFAPKRGKKRKRRKRGRKKKTRCDCS